MSKTYYKTVSNQNDNTSILEFDNEVGGGVLFDLVNLESRVLISGEVFPELYEIGEYEFAALAEMYFLKLGIELSRGNEKIVREFESMEEANAQALKEAFESVTPEKLAEMCEMRETYESKMNEPEDEKTFKPKVAFTLIHKDIQINGFTERTLPELINFISEAKKNYNHMLIKDVDGEIFAMADARVVHEASFEFESS